MYKKILSIILMVALAVTMVPLPFGAAYAETSGSENPIEEAFPGESYTVQFIAPGYCDEWGDEDSIYSAYSEIILNGIYGKHLAQEKLKHDGTNIIVTSTLKSYSRSGVKINYFNTTITYKDTQNGINCEKVVKVVIDYVQPDQSVIDTLINAQNNRTFHAESSYNETLALVNKYGLKLNGFGGGLATSMALDEVFDLQELKKEGYVFIKSGLSGGDPYCTSASIVPIHEGTVYPFVEAKTYGVNYINVKGNATESDVIEAIKKRTYANYKEESYNVDVIKYSPDSKDIDNIATKNQYYDTYQSYMTEAGYSEYLDDVYVMQYQHISSTSLKGWTFAVAIKTDEIEDDYIEISTVDDLNKIREKMHGNYILTNDIVFSESDFEEGGQFYNSGKGWIPLGADTEKGGFKTPFTGTLDGNGHIISGLKSGRTTNNSLSEYGHSLLAENFGTIKNLGVVDSEYKVADMNGTGYLGGIVSKNSGTIKNCYFEGDLISNMKTSYLGGIAATNKGNLENCYTTATILCTNNYYENNTTTGGGLVGTNAGSIKNCYSISNIRTTVSGGICGNNTGNVSNCLFYKTATPNEGITVTGAKECTLEELKDKSEFSGFDFENDWSMEETARFPFPTLKNVKHIEPKDNIEDFLGGNGKPYNPYLVSSTIQLNNVQNYSNESFELTNNIVFDEVDFESEGIFYNEGNGWGVNSDIVKRFYGVFDGNGYSVSGMLSEITSGGNTNRAGLFDVNRGVIKNVVVKDYEVKSVSKASSQVGTIASKNDYLGVIQNCSAESDLSVIGNSVSLGGMVSQNYGLVEQCSNKGALTADGYSLSTTSVGGIVETNQLIGIVRDCYNSGSLVSEGYVGGIVGKAFKTENSSIRNCYNVGSLKGETAYSIVASAGTVMGQGGEALTENCYYLSTVDSDKMTIRGQGFTDAKMQDPNTFKGFDFEKIWAIESLRGDYRYPQLIKSLEYPVEKIEILGDTTENIRFIEGLQPDLSELELKVYYKDGQEIITPLLVGMVSGLDNRKIGEQNVSVIYGGAFADKKLTFEVVEKSVSELSILQLPNKLSYIRENESLDISGMKLLVEYDNGDSKEIEVTSDMVEGFDNSTVGTNTITVNYGGKQTSLDVAIVEIESVKVTKMPDKVSYVIGQKIDPAGGEVTITLSNGETRNFDLSDFELSYDKELTGTVAVGFMFYDAEGTFDVTINEKVVDSIVLVNPSKTVYVEGQDLDVSGGSLKAIYESEDGYYETFDLELSMISGYDKTQVGVQVLTVEYGGQTTSLVVNVIAREVTSIEINQLPNTLEFLEGKDLLDVSGGVIKANYNDDTSENVTMTPQMVSGFDNTKVGNQQLTISFEGATVTYDINIVAKSVSSIEMTDNPNITAYLEGKDNFVPEGGKIKVIYNNDTEEIIDLTADMVCGFDNTKVGNQVLTVKYGEKETTFSVDIIAKELSSIEIGSMPEKTEYILNTEELVLNGGTIKLIYNNDTYEILDMDSSMVSGFDNSNLGTKEIIVSYEDAFTSFEIVVVKELAKCTIEAIEAVDYTGYEITPEVFVKEGDTLLVKDRDYVVTYSNNIEAGEATVTVEGIGDYRGTISTSFIINKILLPGVSAEGYNGVYDKYSHTLYVTAPEGSIITYSTSKDGEYTKVKPYFNNVGSETVYYRVEKGSYFAEGAVDIVITPAEMTDIKAEGFQGEYTGEPQTINVTAPSGANVSYSTSPDGPYSALKPSLTDVGILKVYYKVEKNNYVTAYGSEIIEITPLPIYSWEYAIMNAYEFYDGQPHGVEIVTLPDDSVIKYASTEDGPYSTEPITLTNAGELEVFYKIEKKNYETIYGSATINVDTRYISSAEINVKEENFVYDGTPKTLDITITDFGKTLVEGVDYTVTYEDNVNWGMAMVTITGIGNYEGTSYETFIIDQASASSCKTSLSTTAYTYNGKTKTPSVTVYNSQGKKLVKGTDYEVKYASGRKSIGRYKVTVTFEGNYSGSKNLYFTIGPKNPSSVKTTLYGYDDVKVSWSKVSGASGYRVYYKKSGASSYTFLKTTTSTSYKKSNLSDGAKYYFKVVAYKTVSGNKCYNAGKTSSIYTLKKVSGVKAAKSSSKVKISWTNIAGESGYQISKSTSKSKTNVVATYKTTSGKSKTISATKGKTYYYKVRAYKTVGDKRIYGPWSSVVKYKR